MAMVVNHNIPALSTYNVINSTSSALQKSINKLSTGLRINSAADDAAGLAISEKMRAQVRGLDQAVSNSQDGISMIQTAEGALSETHSILQRMRELSVQAANDTLTQQDRGYIQEEVDQLREEITRIGNTTQFNKKKLLNGDAAVLWSSDDLETKAVVNGGLRTIDQFGQKSSAEGNYKISIKAVAGQGEVQKTDLMKIKHDIDFDVVGTSKFNGAALENEANVEGVGSRMIDIKVGDGTDDMTYTITLQHDLKDSKGLADAINAAMEQVTSTDAIAAADAKLTSTNDLVSTAKNGAPGSIGDFKVTATVDDNGNLQLTNTKGYNITIDKGNGTGNSDDLQKILGANNDTTLKAQEYQQTLKVSDTDPAAWGADLAPNTNYDFKVKLNGTSEVEVSIKGSDIQDFYTDAAGTGAEKAANAKAALMEEVMSQLNTNSYGLRADLDDAGNLRLKSTGGSIEIEEGTNKMIEDVFKQADLTAAGVIVNGNTVYTNKSDTLVNSANEVDTHDSVTNFARNFNDSANQAAFSVKVGSTTADITIGTGETLSKKVADPTYKITVDDLVTDIREQIQATDLKDQVSVTKTEDGKVRIFADGADLTITATDGDKGTLNAIFGNLQDDETAGIDVTYEANPGTTAGAINKIVVKSAKENGTTNDIAQLTRDYAFAIQDPEGNEIANINLSGPFEDTVDDKGNVTKTALENMADAINTQLKAVDGDAAADFKAVVTTASDGTKKLALYSNVRDFQLADGQKDGKKVDNKSVYGYESLFGVKTVAGAEKNQLKEISTIGDVATSKTNLRDLEKFWDSEGNFMLKDPQTLTLTQGDGKQAKITLYEYDTLGSMAEKINNAIANDLGQAKYVTDSKDANGKTIDSATKFATFVDKASEDSDGNKTNTSESVEGTMLIRSVVPGSNGSISFSGNESLINALSLNTIQGAKESQYEVTIKDAHSGDTVVDAAKITGNKLVGALHPNVDVEFDAMAGVTASWDDEKKNFVYTDSKSATPAETYTTFLHLTDNTTVFQIGANEGEDMGINIGDMRSHALGLDEVNVTNRERAARSITVIDNAIDKVSMQRSKLGAYQNRLEHTINNLTTANENLTAAESRIRDTDMAKEMMNFSKLQIMLQAGNSMMAQANQLPQNVLSLVR